MPSKVIVSDSDKPSDDCVLRKVYYDLEAKGIDISKHLVRSELDKLLKVARDQLSEKRSRQLATFRFSDSDSNTRDRIGACSLVRDRADGPDGQIRLAHLARGHSDIPQCPVTRRFERL